MPEGRLDDVGESRAESHPAFPSGFSSDQSFIITRNIIPSATSQLQYYDRARFTVGSNILLTQVSADGGSTWSNIASRNGVNFSGSSAEWDANWISRNVSLAAYAGQIINLRFSMKINGISYYQGVDSSYGFFIDDVTVTNATQLTTPTTTTLPGNATSFTLNATTAGASLIAGTSYNLRIRPNVGCRWFGYGSMKTVTVKDPYTSWALTLESANGLPAGTISNLGGDPDQDGRSNLIEYAFATSPVTGSEPTPRMPVNSVTATHFVVSYQRDAALTDLVFTPQTSPVLGNWKAPGQVGAPVGFTDTVISTVGTLETREAKIPLTSGSTCFIRIQVTRP